MKKVMIVLGLFLASAPAFAWNAYNYQDYSVNTYSNVDYSVPAPDYRVCAVAITRDLHMGSSNNEVTTLQDYLHDQGYLLVSPNGYFGSATRKAVIIFQNENGISATGVVSSRTREAINDAICNVDSVSYGSSYDVPTVSRTTEIPTTYVSQVDPFVTRILATQAPSFASSQVVPSLPSIPPTSFVPVQSSNTLTPSSPIIPATSQIHSTTIVNNPSTGFTVGIIPQSSSITITSPLAKTIYSEGDTINVTWTSSNLNANGFQILLENMSTSQSRPVVTLTSINSSAVQSASFVLTKELLDAVCANKCNANQQESFRIVVSTPVTDIGGNTSNFRATVSPITVKRATEFLGGVSITATKNPVNSGESFKIYTSIPTGTLVESGNANLYSFRLRALCTASLTVNIAGTSCGIDIPVPFDAPFFNQQIPVMVTNSSWYKQDATFELLIVNSIGQVVSTSRATVTVNPNPFNW